MTRKVGIGGGVFDPIHNGHLFLFSECADRLNLDEVLVIPAFNTVHKAVSNVSDYDHRREMTRLACIENKRFKLCEIEKDLGGPSYTLGTLRALKNEMPDTELYFLVGMDNLEKIETWYHPEEIVEEATVVVGSRPVNTVGSSPVFKDKVRFLDMPLMQISSTDIRDRVKDGRPIRYLVPKTVEDYIYENGLYK